MYLTYAEYVQRGGNAPEGVFLPLQAAVAERINLLTHGRAAKLSAVPDALKETVLMAVERMRKQEEQGEMQSFQNDGMSVSYVPHSALEKESETMQCIVSGLYGLKAEDGKTPLVYAGMD